MILVLGGLGTRTLCGRDVLLSKDLVGMTVAGSGGSSASLSTAHDVTFTAAQTEPLLTPGPPQHDRPVFPDKLKPPEMGVKPSIS